MVEGGASKTLKSRKLHNLWNTLDIIIQTYPDRGLMKTLILLTLVFSQSVYSKSKLASEDTSVKAAVNTIDKINRVAKEATSPGAECREEQVDLPRDVQDKTSSLKVIVCRPDSSSLTQPTGEDYTQLISDYKIEFHPNAAAHTGTRDWRLFVHELKKFPPELMREMASVGGKIRVMSGNGVSEDPQWNVEKLRAVELNRRYREWFLNPKTPASQKVGRPEPMSDAQAAAGFEITTEGGRQWDMVSGAGGVFNNPNAISPTRIVLNRMYFSAHREADGSISHNRMQGASNLFLHEHAHALDNIYGAHTISRSRDWQRVMSDPKVAAYLPKIFSDYEGHHAEEGFAEAFSYYHSCEASRRQMETEAPALAEYLRTFSVEKLRALRPTN